MMPPKPPAHGEELRVASQRAEAGRFDEVLSICRLVGASLPEDLAAQLDDAELAAQIRSDAPHLLIDLSGHTDCHCPAVMVWRPAPVQASWLGYFGSTGVSAIDYLLADAVSAANTSSRNAPSASG